MSCSPDSQHIFVQKPRELIVITRDTSPSFLPLGQAGGVWNLAYRLPQSESAKYTMAEDHGVRFSADSRHIGIFSDHQARILTRYTETGQWHESFLGKIKQTISTRI
jgi:hypothetical protein